MRIERGPKEHTSRFVWDDFRQGCVLVANEDRFQQEGLGHALVWLNNWEPTPDGGLRKRADGTRIDLIDPATGAKLQETVVRWIHYEHVNGGVETLLATRTRLFLVNPYEEDNLTEILLNGASAFWNEVDLLDLETFYDKLYIGTGRNHMLQYNGRELTDVSKDYPAGYRFPSVCRRHMGRLFLSGFTDLNDSRAQSQLRWTEIADATTLYDLADGTPAIIELRTADDESPVAMFPLQSGYFSDQPLGNLTGVLLVGKPSTLIAVTGNDFAAASDVQVTLHTPGVGVVGPGAWTLGRKGAYFCSDHGVYLVNSMQPAACVSKTIAPIWGRQQSPASVPYPTIRRQALSKTRLTVDPENGRVIVILPIGAR